MPEQPTPIASAIRTILTEYAYDLGVPPGKAEGVIDEVWESFSGVAVSEDSARRMVDNLRELAEEHTRDVTLDGD